MKSRNKIESILENTPAPSVRAGLHRESLKAELMDRLTERNVQMKMDKPRKLKGLLRVAAMILAAVVLVSAGWAAEQTYRKVTRITWTDSESTSRELTLPSGKIVKFTTSRTSGVTTSDHHVNIEQAQADQAARWDEIGQAILDGKYKLMQEHDLPNSPTLYGYYIELPNDSTGTAFVVPLEKFESWEQFRALEDEVRRKHSQMCDEAIDAGRYRLVDADVFLSHVCREAETGEEIVCQRVLSTIKDIEPKAIITSWPRNMDVEREMIETTWQDHLDAIVDGSRELINTALINSYVYELILSDGRVVRWSTGGGNKPPLD